MMCWHLAVFYQLNKIPPSKAQSRAPDSLHCSEWREQSILVSSDVMVMSMPLIVNCSHCLAARSVNTALRGKTTVCLDKACSTHSMAVSKEDTDTGMTAILSLICTYKFRFCFLLHFCEVKKKWYLTKSRKCLFAS